MLVMHYTGCPIHHQRYDGCSL